MNLPNRKPLAHAAPSFVRPGEVYFLTICGEPRGRNQFADEPGWSAIVNAARNYHERGRWHCRLLLAMPDHVHALASFPPTESMKRVVTAWKHFLARDAGLSWQRDFFDHRLRSHESLDEKAAYIRANPVRAGLVERTDDWPYLWNSPGLFALPMN